MCVFCAITTGETAADIVFEDDANVGFLDIRPVFPGHTLLVPRTHYETLPDLPAELVPGLFATARMLASAIPDALGADGTFVAINNKISQSVPHLHVHVVPRRHKDGLKGFFWPRRAYGSDGERLQVADSIRASVARLS